MAQAAAMSGTEEKSSTEEQRSEYGIVTSEFYGDHVCRIKERNNGNPHSERKAWLLL